MTARKRLIDLIIKTDGKTQEEAEIRADEIIQELIAEQTPSLEEQVRRKAKAKAGIKK